MVDSCWGCKAVITEGSILKALEHDWHPDCFKCNECDKAITGGSFAVKNDMPVHTDCAGGPTFSGAQATNCTKCGKALGVQSITSPDGDGLMHPECFRCFVCKKVIDGTLGFVKKDGQPHCAECVGGPVQGQGEGCVACGKDLVGPCLTANNKSYHKECFACTRCHGDLSGGFFSDAQDHPFCAPCYQIQKDEVKSGGGDLDIRVKSNIGYPDKQKSAPAGQDASTMAREELRLNNRQGNAFGGATTSTPAPAKAAPAKAAPKPTAAPAPAAAAPAAAGAGAGPKFCGECGAVNRAKKFCGECGFKFV